MTARMAFEGVGFSYGAAPVLDGVSFALAPGSLTALIGANGAGKTTLVRLASGTLRPSRGKVLLDGADLHRLPASQRARRIAVVPQALEIPFAFTVEEMVGLGRTPYLHRLRGAGARDREAVARALAVTETSQFADRNVQELSGGERQRVILAMALAQEPDLLLLDEPTANLDVAHQLQMLELIRGLSRREGLTALAAVHDLNLAALCFERIIALDQGRILADGTPREVLTPATVTTVYGSTVRIIDHPTEPVPLVALIPKG